MFLDITPIEPAVTNNVSTIIIVSVAVVAVIAVAVVCTLLIKKKNAK